MSTTQDKSIVLNDFECFGGKHCWTTSLKNTLAYQGLLLSEEMLFGLGGGTGFIYWYMKNMPWPMVGGRYGKGMDPFVNTCRRIGADATVVETSSADRGYALLREQLRAGEPAITFVDMVYLPYLALPEVAHFGGHTIVVYGVDEERDLVLVSDRSARPLTVSIADLRRARNSSHGPFAPRNRLVRVTYPERIAPLGDGVRAAIRESCDNMLHPPIRNIGLAGMLKWAQEVPRWASAFEGKRLFGCLFNVFVFIEVSGTGGSAFRRMYAQFLRESSQILGEPELARVAGSFDESARIWSEIAVAALPDWWPSLRQLRELSVDKNRLFELEGADALPRMQEINREYEALMEVAARELRGGDVAQLLDGLRQKVLECHEVEKRAFEGLCRVVA